MLILFTAGKKATTAKLFAQAHSGTKAEGLRLAATAHVSSNSTRKECHDAQGLSSYPELGNFIAVRNAGFIGSKLETVYGSI